MKLTFDEAIENHRKMWNWIADETEKKERIVTKSDYFDENKIDECLFNCFCCEYTSENSEIVQYYKPEQNCKICPIDWGREPYNKRSCQCCTIDALFSLWEDATDDDDWRFAAKYAREMANLPARKL